jgi:hypothetical protein
MLLAGTELGPPGEWDSWQLTSDLTALDRQGEIEWFRAAFATELAEAGRLSGIEPSFRWGLVYWYS